MRMTFMLAILGSLLASCATLNLSHDSTEQQGTDFVSQSYDAQEMGDASQAPLEIQAAEQQKANVEVMNEQRSNVELDSLAQENSGTDNFYATTGSETPLPTVLPEKKISTQDDEVKPTKKPAKKPAKIAKKEKKAKLQIASVSKKSKKHLAKSKKSKKMNCHKIAKHSKKTSKRDIAMCKSS